MHRLLEFFVSTIIWNFLSPKFQKHIKKWMYQSSKLENV